MKFASDEQCAYCFIFMSKFEVFTDDGGDHDHSELNRMNYRFLRHSLFLLKGNFISLNFNSSW